MKFCQLATGLYVDGPGRACTSVASFVYEYDANAVVRTRSKARDRRDTTTHRPGGGVSSEVRAAAFQMKTIVRLCYEYIITDAG